ncbi:hypothetical protein D187_006886 [Cystobacter fuscus DSM 2262]|jgi:hypothetical protein|uniref:Uncharacterized protein n=1 Tax=Cystobacter fuscus (strain ATCC 25194 / DSM 2262 / NBRC 100088 / M29) TaxID=1242864 RepID=S9P4K8_CYSF2|nr:hypothetical protein [Cystobacter fuscus]EPX57132.1 hypothetical protein D187_006886 [Cystobacter fuscus DSM 2262]
MKKLNCAAAIASLAVAAGPLAIDASVDSDKTLTLSAEQSEVSLALEIEGYNDLLAASSQQQQQQQQQTRSQRDSAGIQFAPSDSGFAV